jgi:mono/diheme cytochrome c family protein
VRLSLRSSVAPLRGGGPGSRARLARRRGNRETASQLAYAAAYGSQDCEAASRFPTDSASALYFARESPAHPRRGSVLAAIRGAFTREMPELFRRRALVTATAAALASAAFFARSAIAADPAGKTLYEYHCEQCHGIKGDGHGPAAPYLQPRPRDFTSGKFKIRTTPNGAPPTDDDLFHIIRVGMPYTAMPAWPQLKDEDVRGLVEYVKSFGNLAGAKPENVDLPEPPASSDESVARGKQIYADTGCARCHGDQGRANGISATTLTDDWGYPIRPADLTKRWTFRGGPSRKDIFRAMTTGLNGTPMPSFQDSLTVEQRWDLVNFIYSLGKDDRADYATVVSAKKLGEAIDLGRGDELFKDVDPAYFPVLGQIIQPVREFHPSSNGITVRAVYDESDLAIEVRWHDMRADKTGKNAPDLAVPKDEDAPKDVAPASAAGGEEGDIWGDAAAPAAEAKPAAAEGGDFWGEGGGEAATAQTGAEFSDAIAVQFPRERPTTIRKPYFLFGDKQASVDLWYFDLARPQPVVYVGHGSDNLERVGPRDLTGSARYEDGEWIVVFKRRLRSTGTITFEEGSFTPIAFHVWDGTNRERGSKRGITTWWTIYLAPAGQASPVGEIAKWAGGLLVLEVAFIGWARRRKRRGA